MKTLLTALILSALSLPLLNAQGNAMVDVGFPDGLLYYANQVSRTATSITVDFLHSGARYTFDNQGNILQSNGAYPAGGKVNLVVVSPYEQGIYHLESFHSIDPGYEFNVGVVFGDGKLYYGKVAPSGEAGWASIFFYHSNSTYTIHREGGVWKVWSTDKGSYPKGHTLRDIFKVGDPDPFYIKP